MPETWEGGSPPTHSPIQLNMKGVDSLTIKGAKKVLGISGIGVSDDQIEKDIEAAILLKNLFFEKLREAQKKTSVGLPNVP